MRSFPRAVVAVLLFVSSGAALSQVVTGVHGRVVDRQGLGVGQAAVLMQSGTATAKTLSDATGAFALDLAPSTHVIEISATAGRMSSGMVQVADADLAAPIELVVTPDAVTEQVNVVATRSGIDTGPSARTVTSLTGKELERYPALTLDERLRQHAGFELFRRSSGWVQNPTSQGISLRGLGSTAASRTLVLTDDAPLNDPFGGWVHWNELPPQAIEAVTIASGGGSDLYGSSAVGGVIDLLPAHPIDERGELSLLGAGEDTASASGREDMARSKWAELGAGQYFRTDGYTLVAPDLRGAVDIPANIHLESGRVEINRRQGDAGRGFVVGNVLNEARSNGTPDQTNGTRLWRYLAGDDWTGVKGFSGRARLFGSDEAYRQRFSAIGPGRASESLSRLQHVETQELGGSADVSFPLSHGALVAGADVRDIRATDFEVPVSTGVANGFVDTTARQRFLGGFGEGLGEYRGWSGAVSLRADRAQNISTEVLSETAGALSTKAIPNRSEVVLSPRLGVVRKIGSQVDVHVSGFRAFRAPTMNELYRPGQVGQETTLANAALVSERATGAEGGVAWRPNAGRFDLDATYFWTEINRPVSAVTLSSTQTKIIEMRENLGQIQSQGVEIGTRLNEGHAISATAGYQYAHAVVTKFSAMPALVGKWIPQVPRNSATLQLRAEDRRLGAYTLALRESGRAFDDSGNLYTLHGFFTMDGYAERSFGQRWTIFAAGQNLLNRAVDLARTPVLTEGTPRLVQGGIRIRWGNGAR